MRAHGLDALAHGLRPWCGDEGVYRKARAVTPECSAATHLTLYYLLVVLVAATLGGAAYAVADYVTGLRSQPVSVMRPGYNPPPPHIPIS